MDIPRHRPPFLVAGLLTLPALAHAQEEVSARPAPPPVARPLKTALNVGVQGHTHRLDAKGGESPALSVSMERAFDDHVSAFVGTLFTTNSLGLGVQGGARISFGERPLQGAFVSAQGSLTWFDAGTDANTGYEHSGRRQSLSALVGYSHPFANRWVVSLGAGVQHVITRAKSEPPLLPVCIYFVCPREPGETTRTETESFEPLLQLGTTFRF
ncbi:autotransporter outer membrane beta-barrel domain-containing protein [Myxococcus stipitatus]|uniref:autotransporter outer membrane beta-barrel domain-containing protein n=1 Tax=Myxococcus stipitatus TaxID=83455 RepID=UPI00314544BF